MLKLLNIDKIMMNIDIKLNYINKWLKTSFYYKNILSRLFTFYKTVNLVIKQELLNNWKRYSVSMQAVM